MVDKLPEHPSHYVFAEMLDVVNMAKTVNQLIDEIEWLRTDIQTLERRTRDE